MKKQRRQTLLLLLLLTVCGGALFALRGYNGSREEKGEEAEGEVIIAVASEEIIRYGFDYEGVSYVLEKEEDTWYDAENHERNLYQYRTAALTEGVAPLVAVQVLENVSDLSQYGLKEPQRTIFYETATESYTLYVGDKNTVTSSYYVSLPSDGNVYVVESAAINRFNVTLEDLTDATEETEATAETSD